VLKIIKYIHLLHQQQLLFYKKRLYTYVGCGGGGGGGGIFDWNFTRTNSMRENTNEILLNSSNWCVIIVTYANWQVWNNLNLNQMRDEMN